MALRGTTAPASGRAPASPPGPLPGWLRAAACAGTAAFAVYALWAIAGLGRGTIDTLVDTWFYNLVVTGSAVACLARAARRDAERGAWLALGVALAGNAVAEILNASGLISGDGPTVADACFLAYYPAAFVGVLLLARARGLKGRTTAWLDGLIAGLAVTAAATALGFDAIFQGVGGHGLRLAVDIAYPVLDLALLGTVVAVIAATGWRPGLGWSLVAASVITNVLADGIYLHQSVVGTYIEGRWVDVLWPLAALLMAAAAWSPVPPRPGEAGRPRTVWLLGLPFLSGLVALGILVADHTGRLYGVTVGLAAATLAAVLVRVAVTVHQNLDMLAASETEARTDALTGLWNRRRLADDVAALLEAPDPDPRILVLFDLDGFKDYNDVFGHPAGDALLQRVAGNLAEATAGLGTAYRMGGDEFCALLADEPGETAERVGLAVRALQLRGEGFSVTASHGAVQVPAETRDPTVALQFADERMYQCKGSSRTSVRRQVRDVLLGVLSERTPEISEHLEGVARLAVATGRELDLLPEQLDEVARAAELHDIGKMAVPDEILAKPGPLDDREWSFIRQHTIVGERILNAAPALRPIGALVRSSHERWDGQGYPDGLSAGEIPLGARIVAACDAYDAMTSDRPYRPALPAAEAEAELRRGAGAQFDPGVVEAVLAALRSGEAPIPAEPAAPRLRPA